MTKTLNVPAQLQEADEAMTAFMRERQQKFNAINGVFELLSKFFPGYGALIDFDAEVVKVTKDTPDNVLFSISIWGDNPRACLMDVMKNIIPIMEDELR